MQRERLCCVATKVVSKHELMLRRGALGWGAAPVGAQAQLRRAHVGSGAARCAALRRPTHQQQLDFWVAIDLPSPGRMVLEGLCIAGSRAILRARGPRGASSATLPPRRRPGRPSLPGSVRSAAPAASCASCTALPTARHSLPAALARRYAALCPLPPTHASCRCHPASRAAFSLPGSVGLSCLFLISAAMVMNACSTLAALLALVSM